MASETEIVNAALRRVGGQRITSITDDVASAGVASDVLALERDEALRSLPWNFAVTRTTLGRLASAPGFEFAYAYALPADNLRVVSVHGSDAGGGQLVYKLESVLQGDGTYIDALLTDSEAVYLRYVRRVVEVPRWSASFVRVLTLRLAKLFATAIAHSTTMAAEIDDELKAVIRQARSVDGIEDWPDPFPEGSWVQSRWGR